MIKLKDILNEQDNDEIQGLNFSTGDMVEIQILDSEFESLVGKEKGKKYSGEDIKNNIYDKLTDEQKKGRSFIEWIKSGLKKKFIKRIETSNSTNNDLSKTITDVDRNIVKLILGTTNASFVMGAASAFGTDEELIFDVINSIKNKKEYFDISNGLMTLQDVYNETSFGFNAGDDYVTIRNNGKQIEVFTEQEFTAKVGVKLMAKIGNTVDLAEKYRFATVTGDALRYMPNTKNGFLGLIEGEMDTSELRDQILIKLLVKGFVKYDKNTNSVSDTVSNGIITFYASPEGVAKQLKRYLKR